MKQRATLTDYWETHSPHLLELGSRPVLEALNAVLEVSAGQRGLNVMSGTGETACRFAQMCRIELVGAHLERSAVEQSRRLAKQTGVADKVTFEEISSDSLPWSDGEFDFVFGDRIGALPNLVTFIRQWVRVCKPGGRLALHELCWLDEATTAEKDRLSSLLGGTIYTLSSYLGLLKTVGLQEVASRLVTEGVLSRAESPKSGGVMRSLSQHKFDALRLSRDHSHFNRLLKRRRLGYVVLVGKKPELSE